MIPLNTGGDTPCSEIQPSIHEFISVIGCNCTRCLLARNFLLNASASTSMKTQCPPHFKCWLEIMDKQHRYGANLRSYFKHWKDEVRSPDSGSFWSWLDGPLKPDLAECRRDHLQRDVVLYLEPHERAKHEICFRDGRLYCSDNELFETTNSLDPVPAQRAEEWIFVWSLSDVLYAHVKITKHSPRFQHTTFLGGEPVQAAGKLVVRQGVLLEIAPHSGHYRPGQRSLLNLLRFLEKNSVDLSGVQVAVQYNVQRVACNTQHALRFL